PHGFCGAARRLATVIHVSFLKFRDKGVVAANTANHAAESKLVFRDAVYGFASEDCLHLVKKRFRNQRLMIAVEHLSGLADANKPHVEGVVQHRRDSVQMDFASATVTQSTAF